MNIDDVEKLILLMQKHDLSELTVKESGLEFSARRGEKHVTPVIVSPALPAAIPAAGGSGMMPATQAAPALPEKTGKEKEITSPIVGTFYRSPAPDQPPYKEAGDRVSADDVVCIVEAMKVMNEIKAGVSGVIKKVLVDNASPVEFGQALFLVEVG